MKASRSARSKISRFNVLPAELQIEIFGYLPTTDIKAARAVNREFRNNATPALFWSIVACARYQAMGAFRNISLHSAYPLYVKEIIFDASLYDAGPAGHERTYYMAQNLIKELRDGSSWQKRTRWKRYQALYHDQQDMVASHVLLHSLTRALNNMPNISSIVYSPHQHLIPCERKDVRDLLPRGDGHGPPNEVTRRHTLQSTADHPFRQFVAAIYLSEYTGIREFKVQCRRKGEPGNDFTMTMFDLSKEHDLSASRYLFQRLIRLELSLPLRYASGAADSSVPRATRQLANLAKLLKAAEDLRHLTLHLLDWKFSTPQMYGSMFGEEPPMFALLGLGTTWPKLRSLSLEGIYDNEESFVAFIKRHQDSLRRLIISKCSLYSGFWADVVDEVVHNASMITSFTLDQVNEADEAWRSRDEEDRESWRYEGHVVVSNSGERSFVESNLEKKSVYELRRPS